jgi:hypothetical protein
MAMAYDLKGRTSIPGEDIFLYSSVQTGSRIYSTSYPIRIAGKAAGA